MLQKKNSNIVRCLTKKMRQGLLFSVYENIDHYHMSLFSTWAICAHETTVVQNIVTDKILLCRKCILVSANHSHSLHVA